MLTASGAFSRIYDLADSARFGGHYGESCPVYTVR